MHPVCVRSNSVQAAAPVSGCGLLGADVLLDNDSLPLIARSMPGHLCTPQLQHACALTGVLAADAHSDDDIQPLTAGYVRSSSMNEPGQRPSSRDSPGRGSRDPRPARMRSNRARPPCSCLEPSGR